MQIYPSLRLTLDGVCGRSTLFHGRGETSRCPLDKDCVGHRHLTGRGNREMNPGLPIGTLAELFRSVNLQDEIQCLLYQYSLAPVLHQAKSHTSVNWHDYIWPML